VPDDGTGSPHALVVQQEEHLAARQHDPPARIAEHLQIFLLHDEILLDPSPVEPLEVGPERGGPTHDADTLRVRLITHCRAPSDVRRGTSDRCRRA
jgi:hypothetical protein